MTVGDVSTPQLIQQHLKNVHSPVNKGGPAQLMSAVVLTSLLRQVEMLMWIPHNSTFNILSFSSHASLPHTLYILYKISKKIKQNTEKSSPVLTI